MFLRPSPHVHIHACTRKKNAYVSEDFTEIQKIDIFCSSNRRSIQISFSHKKIIVTRLSKLGPMLIWSDNIFFSKVTGMFFINFCPWSKVIAVFVHRF